MEDSKIGDNIRCEFDDKWLADIIRRTYYLKRKGNLSDQQIDKIIGELYFDIAKEEKDRHIDGDYEKVAFIKEKIHEYIDMYEIDITKRKYKVSKYKQRLVALTTFLTLLMAIPTGMIIKNRRNNREVWYKTKSSEYSFNIVDNGDGSYEYKKNVYTYHTDYKPANACEKVVKIIDDGAWKIDGKEASKTIRTYSLFDVNYSDIVASGDIDKYIKGVIPSEEVKWVYQNKLKDQEKNQARIYRIVEEIQDLSDGIIVQNKGGDTVKILIVLLVELLLITYVIEYNDGFVSEEIMGLIGQIVASNKVNQEEEKILEELYEKYKQMNYLAGSIKNENKKRNYVK